MVVGGGISGMTAAAAIADQGYETHLVEQGSSLGGMLSNLDQIAPAIIPAKSFLEAKTRQVYESGVNVHLNAHVEKVVRTDEWDS